MRLKYIVFTTLSIVLAALLAVWTEAWMSTCPDSPVTVGRSWLCVRVVDGDTMDMVDSGGVVHRIRLHAVDAPERGQPFYAEARLFVEARLLHQPVRLSYRRPAAWQREEAVVHSGAQRRSINEQLLMHGLAALSQKHCRPELLGEWRDLEAAARRAAIGLWENPNEPLPWEKRTRDAYGSPNDHDARVAAASAYSANSRTGRFHQKRCRYAARKNSDVLFQNRAQAVTCGFTPCGHCRP